MRLSRFDNRPGHQPAFTSRELLLVIVTVGFLLLLILPAILPPPEPGHLSILCEFNLKQVGLAARIWAADNQDRFPMEFSTNLGGTRELVGPADAFRHFQVMSNCLNTPRILVCPDDRERTPGTNFLWDLNNNHLSYFINLDACQTNRSQLLSGDRFLTNGTPLRQGMMTLVPSQPVKWTRVLHPHGNNVLMSDDSVRRLDSTGFDQLVSEIPNSTNHLLFP
jgi:hypothetical protein